MSTDVSISVIRDSNTKMKAEVCLWGIDPETEVQVVKKLAEAAQAVIITNRKGG